jgi:uncharacterized protein YjbJ (UPF0337 family)
MSSQQRDGKERGSMSQDRIHERWTEITEELKRRWHKLTTDDVLYPNGSARYLASVLQERYGIDKDEALQQVFEFESGL